MEDPQTQTVPVIKQARSWLLAHTVQQLKVTVFWCRDAVIPADTFHVLSALCLLAFVHSDQRVSVLSAVNAFTDSPQSMYEQTACTSSDMTQDLIVTDPQCFGGLPNNPTIIQCRSYIEQQPAVLLKADVCGQTIAFFSLPLTIVLEKITTALISFAFLLWCSLLLFVFSIKIISTHILNVRSWQALFAVVADTEMDVVYQ